jgi:SAM-dependent methyltransferase
MMSTPRGSWEEAQQAELGFWVSYLRPTQIREEFLASRLEEGTIRLTQQFGVPSIEGRLLDVGCSPISVHEGREGVEVIAIDPLLDAFCESVPIFARKGRVANVEYRCCRIQDVQDDPFNVVWCVNVLDHTDDWQDIVQHLGRLAKDLLLVGVDVRHGGLDSPCHISVITEQELLEAIEAAGFVVEWHTPIHEELDKYYFCVRARKYAA